MQMKEHASLKKKTQHISLETKTLKLPQSEGREAAFSFPEFTWV